MVRAPSSAAICGSARHSNEPGAQSHPVGQPTCLRDQDRIQVDAGRLYITTQGRCRGKPSHDESQTAPDVGHANSAATGPAEPGGKRRQQRGDTMTELRFLTKALQLAMHPDTTAPTWLASRRHGGGSPG